MTAEVVGVQMNEQCEECKRFRETAELSCDHTVPYTIKEGNAAQMLQGSLNLTPGYINDMKVQVLRDTGATLLGIKKGYVRSKDYTGEHISCRIFGGNHERYELSWVKINAPYISTRAKCAVLPNLCADRIVGNVELVREVDDSTLEK